MPFTIIHNRPLQTVVEHEKTAFSRCLNENVVCNPEVKINDINAFPSAEMKIIRFLSNILTKKKIFDEQKFVTELKFEIDGAS